MDPNKTLYVTRREEWRAWLEAHHATEQEVWLLYYKRYTGVPRIPYEEAVEEALCYGWIDSIVRRIDHETYAQKFTPRKDGSRWSALNRERARRLIAAGRMTEAGLRKLGAALSAQQPPAPPLSVEEAALPPDLLAALRGDVRAWEHFSRFSEAYRRLCLRWINDAKREATRQRRIAEFVRLTAQGQKIGMR